VNDEESDEEIAQKIRDLLGPTGRNQRKLGRKELAGTSQNAAYNHGTD